MEENFFTSNQNMSSSCSLLTSTKLLDTFYLRVRLSPLPFSIMTTFSSSNCKIHDLVSEWNHSEAHICMIAAEID